MKNTLILLVILSISLISCSSISTSEQSFEELTAINSYRPLHVGKPSYGRYNLYSYNLYDHSIEIAAIDADIIIYHAEIFDSNKDGTYDTVWVTEKGVVKFGSILKRKDNPVQTASSSMVSDFIGLGHTIRAYNQKQQDYNIPSQIFLQR
jgi:hypothetical protein